MEILEALFIVFRVSPHSRNIARSLLKEPKVYFYDTGLVKGDEGVRLENLVAVCLLKHAHAVEDYDGRSAQLRTLRTKEKREVDFALVVEDQPLQMIEVKLSDDSVSPPLRYFQERHGFTAIQVVKNLRQQRRSGAIEIRRVFDFLRALRL